MPQTWDIIVLVISDIFLQLLSRSPIYWNTRVLFKIKIYFLQHLKFSPRCQKWSFQNPCFFDLDIIFCYFLVLRAISGWIWYQRLSQLFYHWYWLPGIWFFSYSATAWNSTMHECYLKSKDTVCSSCYLWLDLTPKIVSIILPLILLTFDIIFQLLSLCLK